MRTRLPLAARVGIGLVCALALCVVGVSNATAAVRQATNLPQYCLTIVKRISPKAPDTRIVSQTCSHQRAEGRDLPANAVLPAQTVLLVTFFADVDFGGNFDTVAGQDGFCDSEGYTISDLTTLNAWIGISSYKLGANCDIASTYTQPNLQGKCRIAFEGIDVNYVGAVCNDSLRSMRTWQN